MKRMGKDGMIRVYIVEDEKLVRRGIIGLIDWAKYGMEVVGDAGSGEEAIGFLRRESGQTPCPTPIACQPGPSCARLPDSTSAPPPSEYPDCPPLSVPW